MNKQLANPIFKSPDLVYVIACILPLLTVGVLGYKGVTHFSPSLFGLFGERTLSQDEIDLIRYQYSNPSAKKRNLTPAEKVQQLEEYRKNKAAEKAKEQVNTAVDYTDGAVALNAAMQSLTVFDLNEYSTSSLYWRLDHFAEDIMDISSGYFGGLWASATTSNELSDKQKFELLFNDEEAIKQAHLKYRPKLIE